MPRRAGIAAALVAVVCALLGSPANTAAAAPVQAGFDITVGDLKFILAQIRIAEAHRARDGAACTVAQGLTEANCAVAGTSPLVPNSTSPTDISDARLMLGLRQVDGRNNNLYSGFSRWTGIGYSSTGGMSAWGATGQAFRRLTSPRWRVSDQTVTGFGPLAPSYAPTDRPGNVADPQPRLTSNLVVDQSAANPAAVAAAGADVSGLTPEQRAALQLVIPNTAPNAGVGPAASGMFSLFGQFFDHGLDLVGKVKNEAVFIPLREDDPLYVPGSRTNMMVLSRTKVVNGDPAGANATTAWVDQNQTYTSHPSHQVFLRAYGCGTTTNAAADTQCSAASRPIATGALLDGATPASLPTWADVKRQAATKLGIALTDYDVTNLPLLATDEFGRFLRGPNGFPLLVLTGGTLVEGNPASPVGTVDMTVAAAPVDLVRRTGHAFLDDIAHDAVPSWAWNGTRWAEVHNTASLAGHYVTGDGRGNENIGLTAIHAVFHNEHNRLIEQIKSVIVANEAATATGSRFAYDDWRSAATVGADWNGERLLQAARLVNEMGYQHLVFDEFVARVQPATPAFGGYDPLADPTITAEFAHATYRYGHSQLDEDIERKAANGVDNSLPLFDAFLSPERFTRNYDGGTLTTAQAIGQVARGMSAQQASEIDEFVTGALRNRLLGVGLDLGALNMARGRDTGMQGLNGVRRELFASTGDAALRPYTSWTDLGASLRHPATLTNLVAAYGTHPSITVQSTVAGRREAARLLVSGGEGAPADRGAFMASAGNWAPDTPGGPTITGVDDIDLWMGGLAERRPDFGGLLGTTFDHIFTIQMQALQIADRFYYLGRLGGLNLLAEIETNRLSEIIMRNSDAEGLPALIFDSPTLRFDQSRPAAAYPQIQVLPDSTWRYPGSEHSVFNGTAGTDRQWGGSGNDTLRGNDGADRQEGGPGDDTLVGGVGNDVLTDASGVDTLVGGPGTDVLVGGGMGADALLGSAGSDFLSAGSMGATQVGGQGTDWMLGGVGADTASGEPGDDWMEGGVGTDSMTGDILSPFGIDLEPPGNDVMIGGAGDDLYDGVGGFDISVGGDPGTNSVLGGLGFDWRTYYNPLNMSPVIADLTNVAPPPGNVQAGLADTFLDVEALSGGDFNDTLSGDVRTTLAIPGTPSGDILTSSGLPVIDGLADLLGLNSSGQPVTTWASGDILIGGGGSDTLEGRPGDDLLDGDAYLAVRISAPASPLIAGPTVPDPSRPGRVLVQSLDQLRAALGAGDFTPYQLIAVRTIARAAHDAEVDTVVYAGGKGDYSLSTGPGGLVRVTDQRAGAVNDGTDTLRGIEQIVFADATFNVAAPTPPLGVSARWSSGIVAAWSPSVAQSGAKYPVSGYTARAWGSPTGGATPVGSCSTGSGGKTCTITGLVGGRTYYVDVIATGASGSSAAAPAPRITILAPGIPIAPGPVAATAGPGSASVSWESLSGPGSGVTYTARAWTASVGGTQAGACSGDDIGSCAIGGLTNAVTYYVDVSATNVSGTSTSTGRVAVTPSLSAPGAPTSTQATRANASLVAGWAPPASDGGSPITGYRARAWSAAVGGSIISTCTTADLSCTLGGLTNGATYYVDVVATNAMGTGRAGVRVAGTPASVPSSPASPSVTVILDRTTLVAWAPPSGNGLPITGYTATAWSAASGGAQLAQCTTRGPLSCTLPALPTGTQMWVDVVAANSLGSGPASPRKAAAVPTAPLKPAVPSVSFPGSGQVRVSWLAPGDGGASVSGYVARVWSASSGGELLGSCSTDGALVCAVSGLVPGASVFVGVVASNGMGAGVESDRAAVTLPTVPAAPFAASAAAAALGTARVSWGAPASGGGGALSYTVSAFTASSGGVPVATCTATITTCTLRGLRPGSAYWLAVHASTVIGNGPATTRMRMVLPTLPGRPLRPVGSTGTLAGAARLSWAAPLSTGGAPLLRYRVIAYSTAVGGVPRGSCTTKALTCSISGLASGGRYYLTVQAETVAGAGPVTARVAAVAR